MSQIILDVSNNNPISNVAFQSSGAIALICKATEGTSFQDSTLEKHRTIAANNHKPFGSYLFLHPDSKGSEAEYYLNYAKPRKGNIEPIIDAEVTNLGYEELANRVFSCSNALKKAGYNPILYCGPYVWKNIVKFRPAIKTLRVWEAQYPGHFRLFRSYMFRLRIRLAGTKVVMWQFTDTYKVQFKNYDASVLLVKSIESLLIR